MYKSKHLFFAHFSTKTGDFFVQMEKCQYFATNIYSSEKCDLFFCDFGQKTGRAGLIMLKLSKKRNQVFLKKNLENENFIAAALHCEN